MSLLYEITRGVEERPWRQPRVGDASSLALSSIYMYYYRLDSVCFFSCMETINKSVDVMCHTR